MKLHPCVYADTMACWIFQAERVRRDDVVYLRLEGFGRVDAFEHGKVGERADGFVGPADHWFGEGFHGRWDAVGDAFVVVVGEVVAGAQGCCACSGVAIV